MAERMESLGISVFCQDMAMMLEAGIMPEEAVGLLGEDTQEPAVREALKSMEKEMILGSSFAGAVEKSGVFPDYAADMINTGERAGRLDQVLRSLSGYYERQDNLNRQLRNAVIYPVVLLLMMCAVLVLMVTMVLPVFVKVYENMTGALAQSSYHYITIASAVSWVSLIVIGALSIAVLGCFILYRTEKGKKALLRFLQVFPLTRKAARQLEVSRFIDVLSTFLSSGMDVDTSYEDACKLVTHPELKKTVEEMNTEMIQGKSLSQAFYDHSIVPPLYGRMLLSASRSGQVENQLGKLAQVTEIDAEERIQGLISALEPVLTGCLTLSVGVTLLSIMLPLAGMLSAIG